MFKVLTASDIPASGKNDIGGMGQFAAGTPEVEEVQLMLKAPVTTAADDIYKYFFIVVFRENKT